MNGFGTVDLNAIHPATSPAFSLGNDYLSGPEYARYLEVLARIFHVPLLTSVEMRAVTQEDGLFRIATDTGTVRARTVVWAGGEFGGAAARRSQAFAAGTGSSELLALTGRAAGPRRRPHYSPERADVRVNSEDDHELCPLMGSSSMLMAT